MQPLFLWKLTKNGNHKYDTYTSAIVAARDVDAARKIHPHPGHKGAMWWIPRDGRLREESWTSETPNEKMPNWWYDHFCDWVHPSCVDAEKIGIVLGNYEDGDVIDSSFVHG
jgi:hypothetical protein